jgi:hypothetical protein
LSQLVPILSVTCMYWCSGTPNFFVAYRILAYK